MPSVVVMNYSWEAELGEGREPPLTVDGDLCRIYEGIPFDTGHVTCYGSLYGTVTVKQADHGYDREEINAVAVTAGSEATVSTGSTGNYQILDVDVVSGVADPVAMTFVKEGFFSGSPDPSPTVSCGKETQQNFELICSNELAVTTTYTKTDTSGGILPGVLVTGTMTFDLGSGATPAETLGFEVTTGAAGTGTVLVAGGQSGIAYATKDGYDPKTCSVEALGTYTNRCVEVAPTLACELCQHNTVVGVVTVGGVAAAGYRVESWRTDTWEEVDENTSGAGGEYSLEGFSALTTYRLRLFNTSGTPVSTSQPYTFTGYCGSTQTISYTNGTWTAQQQRDMEPARYD